MKIIRHLDPQDRITYSELQADGTALLLKGDLFKGRPGVRGLPTKTFAAEKN